MAKAFVLLSRSEGKGNRGSDANFSITRSSYVCICACKRKNRAKRKRGKGDQVKVGREIKRSPTHHGVSIGDELLVRHLRVLLDLFEQVVQEHLLKGNININKTQGMRDACKLFERSGTAVTNA